MDQRLRQTESRSLLTWAFGPAATSPEDIVFRQVLQEKYLEPFLTKQDQYKTYLESLARGISVRPIKGVSILLLAGDLPEERTTSFSAGRIASDTSSSSQL